MPFGNICIICTFLNLIWQRCRRGIPIQLPRLFRRGNRSKIFRQETRLLPDLYQTRFPSVDEFPISNINSANVTVCRKSDIYIYIYLHTWPKLVLKLNRYMSRNKINLVANGHPNACFSVEITKNHLASQDTREIILPPELIWRGKKQGILATVRSLASAFLEFWRGISISFLRWFWLFPWPQ